MYLILRFVLAVLFSIPTLALACRPEIGQSPGALDALLEFTDGSPLDLSALRGKPTVQYFGADWCPHCIERGRAAATKVAKKYGPMGLQVIFVSIDDNRFRHLKN